MAITHQAWLGLACAALILSGCGPSAMEEYNTALAVLEREEKRLEEAIKEYDVKVEEALEAFKYEFFGDGARETDYEIAKSEWETAKTQWESALNDLANNTVDKKAVEKARARVDALADDAKSIGKAHLKRSAEYIELMKDETSSLSNRWAQIRSRLQEPLDSQKERVQRARDAVQRAEESL